MVSSVPSDPTEALCGSQSSDLMSLAHNVREVQPSTSGYATSYQLPLQCDAKGVVQLILEDRR